MNKTDLTAERAKWDKVSETYREDLDPLDVTLGAEIAAALAPHLAPGSTLIEAGCGSGHLSAVLAGLGFEVTLLDFSPVALEAARRTFAASGQTGHFHEGNLFDLAPLETLRGDCVWNSGVLEHYTADEMVAALEQMASRSARWVLTLVPNGRSLVYRLFRHWARRNGTWQWGEENLIESMAPFFTRAGLEVAGESYAGGEFIKHFARQLTTSRDFTELLGQALADAVFPADQNYLLLTLGRRPERARAKSATAISSTSPAWQLEEKNRAIARLMEALGDRDRRLMEAEATLAELAPGTRPGSAGAALNERLATMTAQRDEALARVATLTADLAGLRDNLAMARQALSEQKVAYEDKLNLLSSQYQDAVRRCEEAIARHETAMGQFHEASRAEAVAREGMNAAQARIGPLEAEVTGLRENLAMARQALSEQHVGYEEKLAALSRLHQETVLRCEEALRHYEEANRQADEAHARLSEEIARHEAAMARAGEETRELLGRHDELVGRFEEVVRSEAAARQSLADALERLGPLETEVAGLRENLAMARQALSEQQVAYEAKLADFSKHYQQMARDRDDALAANAVTRQLWRDTHERLAPLREAMARERDKLARRPKNK